MRTTVKKLRKIRFLQRVSSDCSCFSDLNILKINNFLLICLIFIGIEEEHVFANEVDNLFSSDRLSQVISIDLPEVGEIFASRIFSQDLGKGKFSWNGRVLGAQKDT